MVVAMYVIIVYDVSGDIVTKLCQYLRQYLNWIQNSVFEGQLTKSELRKIKNRIKEIINEENDSVIVFKLKSKKFTDKEIIGTEKAKISRVI